VLAVTLGHGEDCFVDRHDLAVRDLRAVATGGKRLIEIW
jgi:hypothetical protein